MIRSMNMFLVGGILTLVLGFPATAQEIHPTSRTPSDISWLTQIQQPEVVIDWLAARYDTASQSVVIDNLIINWNDSTDSEVKGHSIVKAFNCVPHGSLVDNAGDSLQVRYGRSKIDVVKKDGHQWVYRVVSPVDTESGMTPQGAVVGQLTLVISAAKVVDRKYTVEGSASTTVDVQPIDQR